MLEIMLKRRSIRKFMDRKIEPSKIKQLLIAAMAAPSSNNIKPWHFIVVTDRTTLNRLAEMHPYGKMLSQAPLCIVVCGDIEKSPTSWFLDCAAATENILLESVELGLGAVWLGVYLRKAREQGTRAILNIPDEIGVLSLIAIGYSAEDKKPRTQYDESIIHMEKW